MKVELYESGSDYYGQYGKLGGNMLFRIVTTGYFNNRIY